jgi:hypothetical protein
MLEYFNMAMNKAKIGYKQYFNVTFFSHVPDKLEMHYSDGEITTFSYEEKLTEDFRKIYPETMVIYSELGMKDGKQINKTYSLYYKRDDLYSVRFSTEVGDKIQEKIYADLAIYKQDHDFWEHEEIIFSDRPEYQNQKDMIEAFKSFVLSLDKYRLFHITGLFKK